MRTAEHPDRSRLWLCFLLHMNMDREDALEPWPEPQDGFDGPITPGGQGGSTVRLTP